MKRRRKQPERDRARQWLQNALACGPVTVEALRWQSHKAGIAWRTVERARVDVAVSLRAGGLGGRGFWLWQCAKEAAPNAKSATKGDVCPVCGTERGDRRP